MKFKKGDNVRIKQAITVEGFETIDFVGWQGWVTEYDDDDELLEVNVEWDTITLKAMSPEYIRQNLDEDFDFDAMFVAENVLEKASKRDKISDRIKVIKEILTTFDDDEEEFDDDEFDDDDVFYSELFESKNIKVNSKNLRKYLAYIKECIEMPCILTGIESMGTFGWEERFDFGGGTKAEHDILRKTQPSYRDEYELLGFMEKDIEDYMAIRVKVKRLSDKKQFIIGLDELKPVDKTSENYAIIDPFVVWYVNYF